MSDAQASESQASGHAALSAYPSGRTTLPRGARGLVHPDPGGREAQVASLRSAASTLDALLAEQGVGVDEVVADFTSARRIR